MPGTTPRLRKAGLDVPPAAEGLPFPENRRRVRPMIAILESPEIRGRVQPIPVKAYRWMLENGRVSKRSELIRGVIVEKLFTSSLHEFLANELRDRLAAALGAGWLVRKEGPLTLSDSEPEPDISVVRGRNADFFHGHPATAVLTVESAVSSESSDREMIQAYAEAAVEECWLVLALRKEIECYSKPQNGKYAEFRRLRLGDTLVSAALPGVSVEIGTLFPE